MFKILLHLRVWVVLLVTALLIPTVLAEDQMEKPSELQIGMVAPDFSLKDEKGVERSLSDYLGKKNVVLAFYPKDFTGG